jgi:predicted nucleic acid-binding protein
VAVREILLDTNAYAAFKRDAPEAVEIIQHAPSVCISVTVLGELFAGFALGSRETTNRQELQQFFQSPRAKLLPVDEGTAERYALIYRSLRTKGKPIPTNDMWIAATALQHDLAVFTSDAHFHEVDGLVVGTQLTDFIF